MRHGPSSQGQFERFERRALRSLPRHPGAPNAAAAKDDDVAAHGRYYSGSSEWPAALKDAALPPIKDWNCIARTTMNAAGPLSLPVAQNPVLTPELLAPLIRHSKVSGPLWVRGTARDVREWSKGQVRRCYGKLQHGDVSLPFCLLGGTFPAEGGHVIIGGILGVNRNFAVEIQGEVAGAWEPAEPKESIAPLPRTRPVLLLPQFLTDNALGGLGFLTTKTGWDDICAASTAPEVRHCPQKHVSFSDESDFMRGLDELIADGVTGIVIARGGGEKLSAIRDSVAVTRRLIETDLPFYTALGHATDLGVLDKHADQSFLTPTDLAHRLSAYIEAERIAGEDRDAAEAAYRERDEALHRLQTLDATVQILKQGQRDADARAAQLIAESAHHVAARRQLWAALAVALLIIVLAILR
jgi:exodeoxyribonuclease VII large subunit